MWLARSRGFLQPNLILSIAGVVWAVLSIAVICMLYSALAKGSRLAWQWGLIVAAFGIVANGLTIVIVTFGSWATVSQAGIAQWTGAGGLVAVISVPLDVVLIVIAIKIRSALLSPQSMRFFRLQCPNRCPARKPVAADSCFALPSAVPVRRPGRESEASL